MSPRNNQVPLTAAYQLMASYLVWDLRDLLKDGKLTDSNARERLDQFIELLDSGLRAVNPAYSASGGSAKGRARAERTKRLASLNRDEEMLRLIDVAYGEEEQPLRDWAQRTSKILTGVKENDWIKPTAKGDWKFIEADVEPFLRRLQRIDQDETFRSPKRSGLLRR